MAVLYDARADLPFAVAQSDLRKDQDGLVFVLRDDMRYHLDVSDLNLDVGTSVTANPLAMLGGDRWPKGKPIRVAFDPNVAPNWREDVKRACGLWSSVTPIRFTEDSADNDCLYFQSGRTNEAVVGYRRNGGKHRIDIISWGDIARIAHEIGHALGLEHEHQRPDASNYITLDTDNLTERGLANFGKVNGTTVGEYDLLSVMHYEPYIGDASFVRDLSKPAYTLKPEYAGYEGRVGIRKISAGDAAAFA